MLFGLMSINFRAPLPACLPEVYALDLSKDLEGDLRNAVSASQTMLRWQSTLLDMFETMSVFFRSR